MCDTMLIWTGLVVIPKLFQSNIEMIFFLWYWQNCGGAPQTGLQCYFLSDQGHGRCVPNLSRTARAQLNWIKSQEGQTRMLLIMIIIAIFVQALFYVLRLQFDDELDVKSL